MKSVPLKKYLIPFLLCIVFTLTMNLPIFAAPPEVTITSTDPVNPIQGETVTIEGSIESEDAAISDIEYQIDGTSGTWTLCNLTNSHIPGDRNNQFDSGNGGGIGPDANVNVVKVLSNKKIVLGGVQFAGFTTYNGNEANLIVRLNSDGSHDSSFDSGEGFGSALDIIYSIAELNDGKILVGGSFASYDGNSVNNIVRINADGSYDSSFGTSVGANGTVYSIEVLSNGKIVIAGDFDDYEGTLRNNLLRLNSDGSIDSAFNPGSGTNTGYIRTTAVQDDGKLIIGGNFTEYDSTNRNRLARINTNGTIDTSFDPGVGPNTEVTIVEISEDMIILGGDFTQYDGTSRARVARVSSDGSLDTSFNPGTGANNAVYSLTVQSDGKVVAVGSFSTYNGSNRSGVTRINTDGSVDTSFDPGSGVIGFIFSIDLYSSDKFIIGGGFTSYNGISNYRVSRINLDGGLDTTFNRPTGADYNIRVLELQDDGRILIGGDFSRYKESNGKRIVRVNSNGEVDTSFNVGTGANVVVTSIKVQPDGKILVGGDFTSYNGNSINRLVRLNSNGTIDTSFDVGTGVNNDVNIIALQDDSKILIGGVFNSYDGTSINRIARINSDGTLDVGFNPGTGPNSTVDAILVQDDGKIIISGNFTTFNGTSQNRITRLNPDGSLDLSFNSGTGASSAVSTLTPVSNGDIYIGGSFTSYNGVSRSRIARINSDGSLDTGFDPGSGVDNAVPAIQQLENGKLMIAGGFTTYNGTSIKSVARIYPDGTLDTTFDPGLGAYIGSSEILNLPDMTLLGGHILRYNDVATNYLVAIHTKFGADFTCSVSTDGLSTGSHAIYLRATDELSNQTEEGSVLAAIDIVTLDTTDEIDSEDSEELPSVGISLWEPMFMSVVLLLTSAIFTRRVTATASRKA